MKPIARLGFLGRGSQLAFSSPSMGSGRVLCCNSLVGIRGGCGTPATTCFLAFFRCHMNFPGISKASGHAMSREKRWGVHNALTIHCAFTRWSTQWSQCTELFLPVVSTRTSPHALQAWA